MSTAIPENFPLGKLDRLNRIKITAFARRFVEEYYNEYQFGHFLLAAYAAVPALLTADLLYKIWQNFYAYTWNGKQVSIHRIAVSDLLLSPLCTERGHDLYEMSEPVRLAFIEWLHSVASGPTGAGWKQAGIHLPDDIARFVFEYEQSVNPGSWRWGVAYDIPQQINNLVYTAPAEAQQVLLSDLRNARTETETLRVLNRIAAMDRQLNAMYRETNQQHLQQFRTLAQFADAWKSLIQQYDTGFLKRLHEMPELKALLDGDDSGIPVRIHKKTLKGVKSIAKPAFRALLIGIDHYADSSMKQLTGCLNDIKYIQEIIKKYKQTSDELEFKPPFILTNEQATISAVTAQINNLSNFNDGDTLLIYFSGFSIKGTEDRLLAAHDSVNQKESITGISQTFVEEKLLDTILEKRLHILWIIDSSYDISPEQYENQKKNRLRSNKTPLKGSLMILHASESGKQAHERIIAGKNYGLFTCSLHEVVMQHELLDYQTLITKIREKTGYNQRPFLEAFPATAALSMFLTGKTGGKVYQVKFEDKGRLWLLNAGFVKGISPSAGFVPTILRTNDQLEWKVLTVTDDTSIVEPIAPSSAPVDQEATYDAIVAQMAPFKTRVALSDGSKKQLEKQTGWLKETDFYYPIENAPEAELKIAFAPSPLQYYITKNNPQQADKPDAPIFLAGDNLHEIERQLYWISRFYFVQRIEGQSAGILNYVNINLEKIEGQKWTQFALDSTKSQPVEGTELTLKYIDDKQPAFRCKIILDSGFQFDTLYFYAFYFGSGGFDIKQIDSQIIRNQSKWRGISGINKQPNHFYIEYDLGPSKIKAVPVYISEEVKKSGITTNDDILFLAFSYEMLDLSVFEQQDIYQRDRTRKETPDSFPEMRLGNWDVLRIPVKVIYNKSDEADGQSSYDFNTHSGTPLFQEIEQKLVELGLLDPEIIGNEKEPFGPSVTNSGIVNTDFITALKEFCRLAESPFDEEQIREQTLQKLRETAPETFLPVQTAIQPKDANRTAFAKSIVSYMQSKSYWIARSPNMYNIVYIEGMDPDGTLNSDTIDEWNDLRLVIRIRPGGQPELVHNSRATTEPGKHFTLNPLNPDGVARVGFGQYKAWQNGLHQDKQPALVQRGPLLVSRDTNKTGRRNNTDRVDIGTTFGINQNGTTTSTPPENIGRWSAGTFVGRDYKQHLNFMDIVKKDIRFRNNKDYMFISTLIDGSELARSIPQREVKTTKDPAKSTSSSQAQVLTNGFTIGPVLKPDNGKPNQLFKGRKALVQDLERLILGPQKAPVIFLYGQRRMGKSSLLYNLPSLVSQKFNYIYRDAMSFDENGIDQFAADFFQEINQKAGVTMSEPWLPSDTPEQKLLQLSGYLGIVAAQSDVQWLVAIDEYQQIDQFKINSERTSTLLTELNRTLTTQDRIILLFSGEEKIKYLKNPNWKKYFSSAVQLEIGYLNFEEAKELITKPYPEFRISYGPAEVEEIFRLTHGHPFLIQLMSISFLELANSRGLHNINKKDIALVAEQISRENGNGMFESFWTGVCASPAYKNCVISIIQTGKVTDQKTGQHLSDLDYIHLLDHDGDDYRISIPLLQMWLQKHNMV